MGAGTPVAACAPSWLAEDRAPSRAFGCVLVVCVAVQLLLSPDDPAQLVSARRGLKWDVSTKRYHQAHHSLRPNRPCMHMHWRTSLQLRVGPEPPPRKDVAGHWMGQQTHTCSLNIAELTDLVGEAQALPSLAVATCH